MTFKFKHKLKMDSPHLRNDRFNFITVFLQMFHTNLNSFNRIRFIFNAVSVRKLKLGKGKLGAYGIYLRSSHVTSINYHHTLFKQFWMFSEQFLFFLILVRSGQCGFIAPNSNIPPTHIWLNCPLYLFDGCSICRVDSSLQRFLSKFFACTLFSTI